MHDFCTYFDSGYLTRALALHSSLADTCGTFRLWALCFDDLAYESLSRLRLEHVEALTIGELERANPGLAEVRAQRSRAESYFTCTPFLPSFILARDPRVETVTYLDADLFFFNDPAALISETGDASIALIEHRFPPQLRHLESFGVFNVGWLSFRADPAGTSALKWWQARCLEWCHDRPEDGRFADQKYLDDWPSRFPNTVVLQHPGANVAPWNLGSHVLSAGQRGVEVDGQPLLFYHYHGLRQLARCLYDLNLGPYGARATGLIRKRIYGPYLRALDRSTRVLRDLGLEPPEPGARHPESLSGHPRERTADPAPLIQATRALRRSLTDLRAVVARHYAVVCRGRVL